MNLITLTNENASEIAESFRSSHPVKAYCQAAENSSIHISVNSPDSPVGSNIITVESPYSFKIYESFEEGSRLLLFSYDSSKYSFEDITPFFLNHLESICIAGKNPGISTEYEHTLTLENSVMPITDLNGKHNFFPVFSSLEGIQIFVYSIFSSLRTLSILKFRELGFSDSEFDDRVEKALNDLSEKFS